MSVDHLPRGEQNRLRSSKWRRIKLAGKIVEEASAIFFCGCQKRLMRRNPLDCASPRKRENRGPRKLTACATSSLEKPLRVVINYRRAKEKAVYSIQHPAVSGKDRARIFHARTALEHRFRKVAYLPEDADYYAQRDDVKKWYLTEKNFSASNAR